MRHDATFDMTDIHSKTPFDRYEDLRAQCAAHAEGSEISDELWNKMEDTIDEATITPCQNLADVVRKLTILLDVIDEADCKALALATSISNELALLVNEIDPLPMCQPGLFSTPAQNSSDGPIERRRPGVSALVS